MLLYLRSSAANARKVEDDESKKPKLAAWQQDDAARLRDLFDAYRAGGGLKQEDFAHVYGLKSQGNLGHYLHARRPLNLRAATCFAKGLGKPIESFSPYIADEVKEAIPHVKLSISRDGAHLSLRDLNGIEGQLVTLFRGLSEEDQARGVQRCQQPL